MIRRQTLSLLHHETFSLDREDHCNGYPVYNLVLVCPLCLNHWLVTMWDDPSQQNYFDIQPCPCEEHWEGFHPDLSPVPGSILHNRTVGGFDRELLNAIKVQVPILLAREFSLHLNAFSKEEMYECNVSSDRTRIGLRTFPAPRSECTPGRPSGDGQDYGVEYSW